MSDSKHTPGPWRVYEDRGSDAYEVVPDHCDFGDTVAVYGRTRAANARLIAAAPELLGLAREAAEVGETIAALACAPDGSYRVPCDATKAELVSIITDLGTKAAALINSATKEGA